MKTDLVEEHLEGYTETYYSFGHESEQANEPTKSIVLPEFDSLMMGHKDRSRFLSPDMTKGVFRPFGVINPTILLDGFVVATWRKKRERTGITVSVVPFRHLNARERRAIEERFGEYGDYLGNRIAVGFRASP